MYTDARTDNVRLELRNIFLKKKKQLHNLILCTELDIMVVA